MEDMVLMVDKFLSFNEFKILQGLGKVKKVDADKKALNEYEVFNKTQKINSDFEKVVKGLVGSG